MADAVDLLFYRGIERWMIVIGGLIFGYLGYRLFLYGVDQGQGKLETENQFFKITFSGSGPGLFFLAFGAMILMSGVSSTADWSSSARVQNPPGAGQATAASNAAGPVTVESKFHFSGSIGASDCNFIKLENNRGNFRETVEIYQNRGDPRLVNIGNAFSKLDDADLASVMPTIEKLLCE